MEPTELLQKVSGCGSENIDLYFPSPTFVCSKVVSHLYLFVVKELDASPAKGDRGDSRPDPENGDEVEGHVFRAVPSVLHDRPQFGRPGTAEGDVVEGAGLVGVGAVAVVPIQLARRFAVGVEVYAEEKRQFSTAWKKIDQY